MRRTIMIIPIMTFFMYSALLLNIPLLRDIIIFIYISFIPGFALLKFLKLNKISFLDAFLFSVGLSLAFSMFMSLLVNELYVILGLSQPLSVIPLTVAISAFTLAIFLIDYKRNLSETFGSGVSLAGELKDIFPISIILVLLPILSVLGFLYFNVFIIMLSYAIIAVLCVMTVVSKRLIPERLFPFLIFSISIALVCQVPLTSKHIIGPDANVEYYVFRLTQINGHWGLLNAKVNSLQALNYSSMLSITLLPAVYSALMHAQDEIVFKILYPFIFCLVPLTLYTTFKKQFGKLIGLFSTLFFVFTSDAFYGIQPLYLNRQIVGEFFLVLSVFLLINKSIPVTKRRVLLTTFGAALAVSHYALAFMYLAIVPIIFIFSKLKPKIDDTLNFVTVLFLFAFTFAWYTFGSNSLITSLVSNIVDTIKQALVTVGLSNHIGTAATMYAVPQVFTIATWFNLAMLIIPNLFLIIGVLVIILIILKQKGTRISAQYIILSITAATILAVAIIVPSVAVILNFTRFYAITLLFLAPCFVLGGQTLLVTIRKAFTKIKRSLKLQSSLKSKNVNWVLLLIAIVLSAYFLSQVGFVNQFSGSKLQPYAIDFDRVKTSNESQILFGFYENYIPQQDVNSALWLSKYKVATANVYADFQSGSLVLTSYGLIPYGLILPLTNTTIPEQRTFIYLGTLNIVNGVILTNVGSFNTTEISPLLENSDQIYSNGASEIWYSFQNG